MKIQAIDPKHILLCVFCFFCSCGGASKTSLSIRPSGSTTIKSIPLPFQPPRVIQDMAVLDAGKGAFAIVALRNSSTIGIALYDNQLQQRFMSNVELQGLKETINPHSAYILDDSLYIFTHYRKDAGEYVCKAYVISLSDGKIGRSQKLWQKNSSEVCFFQKRYFSGETSYKEWDNELIPIPSPNRSTFALYTMKEESGKYKFTILTYSSTLNVLSEGSVVLAPKSAKSKPFDLQVFNDGKVFIGFLDMESREGEVFTLSNNHFSVLETSPFHFLQLEDDLPGIKLFPTSTNKVLALIIHNQGMNKSYDDREISIETSVLGNTTTSQPTNIKLSKEALSNFGFEHPLSPMNIIYAIALPNNSTCFFLEEDYQSDRSFGQRSTTYYVTKNLLLVAVDEQGKIVAMNGIKKVEINGSWDSRLGLSCKPTLLRSGTLIVNYGIQNGKYDVASAAIGSNRFDVSGLKKLTSDDESTLSIFGANADDSKVYFMTNQSIALDDNSIIAVCQLGSASNNGCILKLQPK